MEAYEFRKSQNIDVVAGKGTQGPDFFVAIVVAFENRRRLSESAHTPLVAAKNTTQLAYPKIMRDAFLNELQLLTSRFCKLPSP